MKAQSHLKDQNNSNKKLLDLMNMFSTIAGYKISTQNSAAFLYTNNEQTEKEIRKTTTFTIPSKKLKYLGVNLMKDVKDLYNGNGTSLKKEVNENFRRWKDIPCSWTGRVNIVKVSIYYKKQSPSKFQ
jgi:hypothetical protein